jgi:4-amino-4-deoxy-L-arabinose transferase-like glycosyltransferase
LTGLQGGSSISPRVNPDSRAQSFWDRHFAVLACAVLALAAFNLTFRLASEIVTEWDESLYATTAWEMLKSGEWVGTTFNGVLDYYNSKPPLNVWLIALAFKAFGPSLISLRIASVLSAWTTVAVLVFWLRRVFGSAVAVLAGLALTTLFGFLYVHSGRSGNTDAPYALIVLLTVVTLWMSHDRPWRLVWLGPVLAAAFLLKGMGLLMPLAIVLAVRLATPRRSQRLLPVLGATGLFVIAVGTWAAARWRIDQWTFLERLFMQDFVAGTFTVLEEHPGTPFFYVNQLIKDHYDWLFAALVAFAVRPLSRLEWRGLATFWRDRGGLATILGAWTVLTLLIPTIVRTKLPWYLNPFFPAFAVGTGWLIARAVTGTTGIRRLTAVAALSVTVIAAESRLVYYSFHYRDIGLSVQGLLLAEQNRLTGCHVFRDRWNPADRFVLDAIVGASAGNAASVDDFRRVSRPGDYLLSSVETRQPDLELVRAGAGHWLYLRRS